ncbi:MAG: leucine-rich repeat protein [Clostridia bacterium]|nr:leucine-rich repeat protein [Clostridia bacterium]
MKKRISLILVAILLLVNVFALSITAFAEEVSAEDKTITISYMNDQNTTSDTTSLDTGAYSGGKQTVKAGEKFTLPTTSSHAYAGKEGFQLVWYTENGRTYKAGETVSFTEDTKLFRCVAKECYTIAEVNYAMTNDSSSAILMADIDTNSGISVWNQGQSVLILNGFSITITKNSGSFMGSQRSGKHIYGEGTINAVNPDGKLGEYYFFQDQSHGYNGSANRTVIGVDVTINCPTMWLGSDGDGSCNNHYPWTRVYGTVNCYGLYNISNLNNRAPFTEIYEGANVTINGPTLYKEKTWRTNNKYTFNSQAFDLVIYGGTFNLPAEAATEAFWTNDNLEDYVVDEKDYYYNYGLTKNTKDNIKIFGGSFVLPENATPAISDYLTNDWLGTIPSGGDGLYANKNTSTYHVAYGIRPAYKLAFEKYTIAEGAYGKLTVTDYIDGSLSGTYYYQMTQGTIVFTDAYNSSEVTQNTISSLKAYEKLEDGTYVVTNKFELDFGMGGAVLFKNNITSADNKLQNFEANNSIYQTVVPASCEHNFTGAPVDATCEHSAYADYNCTVCKHNVYFSWGEKLGHDYVLGEHTVATLTSLGSKSYACANCGDSRTTPYSLDPTSLEIPVIIRNDDGTFENITVLASDIFDFSTSGSNGDYIYTLSAIKKFGDYNIRNIYGITIPQGILYINITTHNYEKYSNVEYGVSVLTIAEGAKVDIQNIGNLRKVEKIVVEKNTDVVFSSSCSYYNPSNEKRNMQLINTIDLSAGNHSVKFMSYAFDGRSTLTTLKLGENANYDFSGYGCFQYCKITELNLPTSNTYLQFGGMAFRENAFTTLTFPDNLDLSFSDTFYNCKSLTSVKFGENSTYVIGNNCFRYSPIAKVVFAPNSTYTVGSQAFINSSLTEVDASAGNISLTLNGSAFNCWMDNKLYCTLTSFKFGENSTYVINESALSDTTITKLVLAPNSSYTFKRYCINGGDNKANFAEVDASVDNITVVFEGDAFRDKAGLTTLKINGKNSSYTFNGSSFYNTKITEVTLGEGSTYIFNDCFNGPTKIEKIDASADNLNVTVNNYGFGKASLTTLLINGKNGTYTFNNEAFRGSSITELVLGEGSTYTFNSGCFSSTNNLTKFDASASNITATFGNDIFNGKSKLEYVNFGENSTYVFGYRAFYNTNPVNDIVFYSNSTYSFGQEVFVNADFNSIKFEDNVNVTFTGQKAFQYVTAVSLYLGNNFEIDNLPFCDMKYLEKIVIMDGVHFKDNQAEQWTFSSAGSADFSTPLVVYNHSFDMLFAQNMFNDSDGIVLYTVTDNIGTRTDVFSNCSDGSGYKAWTVYLGIPHPMVEGLISNPTCDEEGITGWVSDENYCNCGFKITETMVVNKYENVHNITEATTPSDTTTYTVSIAPAWGHDYGVESPVRIDWIYVDNNYFANAKNKHTCTVCGEDYLGKDIENSALFTAKGMTLPENVKDSLGHAIIVNTSAIQAYNEYRGVGNEIKYGVVAGIADASASPVTSSGKANGNAVVAGFENTNYTILQIRINNIDNPTQGLYLSAYVIIDDTVSYLHNGTVNEKAVTVTLNLPNGINLVAEATKVEATVDNKETIYA